MKIKKAAFAGSSTRVDQRPKPRLPEFAFIGRSNVGKSSLINMLTGNGSLAKTSSTPGKTRLVNHFLINDRWYLVDLPGYGFAKMPNAERKQLSDTINDYLDNSGELALLFVLVDSRHDIHLLLGESGMEDHIGAELHRPFEVGSQHRGVDESLLLGRVGVQFAPHRLHTVQDMPSLAFPRTLEEQVLDEMRHAGLLRKLVARTHVHDETAVGHRTSVTHVHQADTIRQFFV